MQAKMSQTKTTRAFRTISEAGEELGLQPHVLRFWESKFSHIKPIKRFKNSSKKRAYRASLNLVALWRKRRENGLSQKQIFCRNASKRSKNLRSLQRLGRLFLSQRRQRRRLCRNHNRRPCNRQRLWVFLI